MKNRGNFSAWALIFFLCAAGAGCSSAPPQPAVQVPPPVDPAAIAKKIESLDADWSHAAMVGDVDKCVSYYSDDAVMLEPNLSPETGRAALSKAWAGLVTGPQYVSLTFGSNSVTVAQAGDMAYDIGHYELTTKDKTGKTSTERGKFLEVWKKQLADGSWKVAVDIYNAGQ